MWWPLWLLQVAMSCSAQLFICFFTTCNRRGRENGALPTMEARPMAPACTRCAGGCHGVSVAGLGAEKQHEKMDEEMSKELKNAGVAGLAVMAQGEEFCLPKAGQLAVCTPHAALNMVKIPSDRILVVGLPLQAAQPAVQVTVGAVLDLLRLAAKDELDLGCVAGANLLAQHFTRSGRDYAAVLVPAESAGDLVKCFVAHIATVAEVDDLLAKAEHFLHYPATKEGNRMVPGKQTPLARVLVGACTMRKVRLGKVVPAANEETAAMVAVG